MLFAKKNKGFCVEFGDQSVLVARLSQPELPCEVEEMREFPVTETDALREYIHASEGLGPTGYAHAIVGINPAKRLVRRHTLDLKRVKDPAYFGEVLSQQFRVEPSEYTTRVLNSIDGSAYDPVKSNTAKDVVFCGLPASEVAAWQDKILDLGIYPEKLELTSVSTLGGLISYQKFKQSKTPVLLLEVGDTVTQSHILSADGVDVSRPIPSGIAAMIPEVQKELGLKDEESARKLFYSNTFDFTGMGPNLLKRLTKELQSSIGFYEVQTGQSIGAVLCTQLPVNLSWLTASFSSVLGVSPLQPELVPWIESFGCKLAQGVPAPDARWTGLFSLLAQTPNAVAEPQAKK